MAAAQDRSSTLFIEPVEPPGPRAVVQAAAPLVIGRGAGCGLQLDDRHVSKEHARVEWCRAAWYVTDLGSHNGTFVNRWQLAPQESVILRDGDQLQVGGRRFEVRVHAEDRSTATWATRASIFSRLRGEAGPARELAWEEFRARYAPVIVGYSRNAGLPAQDADDVLQDVMLGFFRRADQFRYDPAKGRFRGYLKRATLNAMRKRSRGVEVRAVPDGQLEVEPEVEDAEWDTRWSAQVMARAIAEARDRFDARTFEAFELYARRGVPADEVARQLGMTVNGVHQAKSRVSRLVRSIVEGITLDEG